MHWRRGGGVPINRACRTSLFVSRRWRRFPFSASRATPPPSTRGADGAPQTDCVEPTGPGTRIVKSATNGIDRGWRGGAIDFLADNTFDVAGCKQTYPKDTNGACPDPVPCP